MKLTIGKVLGLLAAVSGVASTVAQGQQDRRLPNNWNYNVDQRGHRVARNNNRVTRPDGSWREEIRQGNCVAIKERSSTGEYRESRQCNPGHPSNPR